MRFDVEVSLALGADISADPSTWSWTDITAYAMHDVEIHRGRSDWQTQAQPSWCTVQLNNADGRFSRLNPNGAYYGQLSKNTPLRIRACATGGSLVTRFVGFVSEWPARWTHGQKHSWVPVRADGVLRRLGQGQTPLKSALYRSTIGADPLAFWPMEDGASATQVASALPSGQPMTAGAPPVFTTGPDGSAGALDLIAVSSSFVEGRVKLPSTTEFQLEFAAVSDQGLATLVVAVFCFTDGSAFTTGLLSGNADGDWHHRAVKVQQNGADVDVHAYVDGVFTSTTTFTTKTIRSNVFVRMFVGEFSTGVAAVSNLSIFESTSDPADRASAMSGYPGELAGARFARLCTEESVAFDVAGEDIDPSYAMGPQTTQTLLNLLRECEGASAGVLTERRTGELGHDLTTARENLPVALALDHDLGHIVAIEPVDDDRLTRNDVTVTRTGGSFGHVELDTGPMSTDPETGAGRYDHAVTLNLETDDQTIHHAGWLVNLGTANEYRFPTVKMMLHKPSMSSLITTWLACDISSRITIDNVPINPEAPEVADQTLEGYTERINAVEWHVTLNLSPFSPYQVGVYAEDEMTLLTAEDTTSTAWRIASEPVFTSDSADLPVSLTVDGEEVSVTAVSPIQPAILAGTPTHGDNASLSPVLPSHVEGDLIVIFAAIRNSGTGTVDSLSGQGYASLDAYGNIRVFGKYATSALMADPTVTFTGGAAGDTTSAVAIRARGCQIDVTNIKEQLNGSAADIAYPYYVVEGDVEILQFCWKQDDYTSVAAGSGLTEVVEASSTTGNDQSLYVARGPNSTDSLPIPIGSHTVTGGAAAISRVIFMTLPRGVADITVTRSVNGVETSHSQLATVQVTHPMNLAL